MTRSYFVLKAKTLLHGAYFMLFLDALFLLGWTCSGIYFLVECPAQVESHALIALHFLQTASVMAVISDWWANLKESTHRVSDTTPIYWAGASFIALLGDLLLFTLQFRLPDPPGETCIVRILHKVLDGYASSICVLSLIWFGFVGIATRHAKSRDKRARDVILEEPDNVYG
jgi:hypothetical protein